MWWLQPRASKNMYSCPCVELLSLRPRISTARRRRRARRIDGTTGGRADGGAMSHVDGADRDATRRNATLTQRTGGQAGHPLRRAETVEIMGVKNKVIDAMHGPR